MCAIHGETDLIRSVLTGTGVARVLVGSRAIGKTTALRRLARQAAGEPGITVLHVAASTAEAAVPGGVLRQLCASGNAAPADGPGLSALLDRHCPVLLLVDDAHWVDARSATALAHAARRVAGKRVGVVLAADAREPLHTELGRLPHHELTGVNDAEAARIVPEAVDQVRAEMLRSCHANPLALREFATLLTPDQLAGTVPLPRAVTLGRRGRGVFSAESETLDVGARTWLLLLAWGPSEFGACSRAATMLGLGLDDLAPAEEFGVVRGVHWTEPLAAAAVRQNASSAETATVCAALVRAIDSDEWPVAHARALGGALREPDRAAAALAAATIPMAHSGYLLDAYAAAVRAAELASARADRDRYRIIAAELVWLAGYSDHALRLLDRAVPRGTDARTSAAVIRAVIHGFRDSWTSGWWLLPTEPDSEPGSAEQAFRLLVTVINAGWHTVSVAAVQRIVLRLRGTVEPSFDVAVGALEHVLAGHSELDAPQSDALWELAWWARPSDALHPKSWPPPMLPMFLGEEHRYARSFSALLDSEPVRGAPSTRALLLLKSAAAEMALGNWDRCLERAAEGARLAAELGHHALRADLLLCSGWVTAARGDQRRCAELVDAAARSADRDARVREPAMARWIRGLAALSNGRPTEAFQHLRGVVDEATTPQQVMLCRLATVDFVEAAVRSGRHAQATQVTEEFATWVRAGAAPWARLDLALCRALADGQEAGQRYVQALDLVEHAGRLFPSARAELRYGSWLRRNRYEQQAREHLRNAEVLFDRLGAKTWSRWAHTELRATGESRQPSPQDELTPQEREIALLAAEGLTNRQIAAKLALSPRTVGYHLYKVFPKLDITSRTQLATVLRQE